MRNLWKSAHNLFNEWFTVITIAIVCIGCLVGVYVQNKFHEVRLEKVITIHQKETDFYKNRYNEIKVSGDKMYEVFVHEKMNSQIKGDVIDRQQKIMQDMLNEINRLKRILQSDPGLWT